MGNWGTGEHATKVTDVWRKRVVAWRGQYGEKLAETNSDLTSPREIRERKCSRKILVPRRQTLPAAASSRDGPFPYQSTVAKGPFQAHLIGVPSVTKHLFERVVSAVVVSSNLERWCPRSPSSGLGPWTEYLSRVYCLGK